MRTQTSAIYFAPCFERVLAGPRWEITGSTEAARAAPNGHLTFGLIRYITLLESTVLLLPQQSSSSADLGACISCCSSLYIGVQM